MKRLSQIIVACVTFLLFLSFVSSSTASTSESQSGKVWQWESDTLQPTIKEGLNDIVSVSVGFDHSLALKRDGTVWAWGSNTRGQLGNGLSEGNEIIPLQVKSSDGQGYLDDVKAIAAGRWYSMVLKNDDTVWVWGFNANGRLGTDIGNNYDFNILTLPTQVKGEVGNPFLTDITAIAAGRDHHLALKSDGRVFAWGINNHGQIGNGCFLGNCSLIRIPTAVLDDVVSIAAACCHSLAVKNDGSVWGWGRPIEGQLASFNNGTAQQPFPIQINGVNEIKEVAAKEFYSTALSQDGIVFEWGGGSDRWLPNNAEPRQIPGLSDVKTVAAGRFSPRTIANIGLGLALKNDGTVWQWNKNDITPNQVPSLSSISSISGGSATPNLAVISADFASQTPLILIPGMAGSEFKSDQTFLSTIRECGDITAVPYIYFSNSVVWLDPIMAAISKCDDYFDVLKLNPDGHTPQYPQIVLNGTFVSEAYGNFIDFFTDIGYELGETLFLFPYDWRKDISLTKPLLDHKIESIKQQTGSEKVDIVAHSMGGLVARNYIADIENAQKVRKLIVLGTPHLGTPEFIKNLMYGGCLTINILKKSPLCFGVNPSEVKDVLQNMIGGFELIPSLAYYTFYSGEDNLHPFPFRDERDIDNNNVTGPLNYSQIKTLLTNLEYNTPLFTPSEAFHTLDENLTETNDVKVSIIAGSGKNTLGQIIEKYRVNFKGIKIPQRDKITINGDETVPLLSVSLSDQHKNLSLLGEAILYYANQEHGALVANGPALNLVNNILNDDSTLPNDVSREPYRLNGHQLSVHSPVELHVYDQDGNHTGKTPDGDFEANIPGSSYDTIDDAKFIWLPDDDGIYNIRFEATGQGSFDFKIRKFKNDLNSQTILYKDVPLTTSTIGSAGFDTQSSQLPILNLDTNGDGEEDFQVDYFSILEGDANYDHTPPEILLDVNPKTVWPPNGKMVDVNVKGIVTDENPYVTTILVEDEYDLVEPSVTTYETEINETIQLQAFRRGNDLDGRRYIIKILATDLAGNSSLETLEILVPHDRRKQ